MFSIDKQCLACNACVVEVPQFFGMDDDKATAFIKEQPKTEEEIKLCLEALKICPVDAIVYTS